MPKVRINDLDNETIASIDSTLNLCGFENYCSACDFFESDDCPFKGRVDGNTEWKSFGCKNFWD